MNRRQVIAAGALLAVPQAAFAASQAAPRYVVFDDRHPESRQCAEVLSRRGAITIESREDVGRLWYGPVRKALVGGGRVSIAGLTTWADFQVIQGCAAEARLKLSSERRGRLVAWAVS
jgi:hypothetical protein